MLKKTRLLFVMKNLQKFFIKIRLHKNSLTLFILQEINGYCIFHQWKEGVPQESDPAHKEHAAELNARFDNESENDVLRLNLVTYVYSERL